MNTPRSGEPLVSALDYFELLVQDAGAIPLFEAAASIATDAEPDVDLEAVRTTFDTLAARLAQAVRNASTESARLSGLLRFFYETEGFAGNRANYYSPANSYLHQVMKMRCGIPITLALLLQELARHIGLDAEGVSFPGHFLVRVQLREGFAIIDPFSGESLKREQLMERAAPYGVPLEQLLQPAAPREILARMLRNLEAIHMQAGDLKLLAKVRQRLEVLADAR